MEKIQRPTQLQTPSIDFSKPRLVQITVTDVGACMPLQPMVITILILFIHAYMYYTAGTYMYMYMYTTCMYMYVHACSIIYM